MKIQVLASGSKGNSTYIESDDTRILIDVGINYSRIKKSLDKISVDLNTLDGIIITHTHSDHIGGLSSLIKKIPESNIVTIEDDFFSIKGLDIDIINGSHDVPAFGFIISDTSKRMLYLTDTGYINRKYVNFAKNLDLYMIESNHDEKMLMEGPYPYILKQRVISDQGHLSNKYTGNFLNKVIGDKTKCIILAHLSENNNTPELALEQVTGEIKNNKIDFVIAKQYEETEMVEI